MTSTFSVSQKISSRHLTQTRRELKALSSNFTFVYQSVTYKVWHTVQICSLRTLELIPLAGVGSMGVELVLN